ncbi:peroxide stress protein YaaA [Pseudonocardia sp. DLS-67]
MLVLLPPSETKRDGGDGPPLRLDTLSHPGLDAVRGTLVKELVDLAADVAACRAALGLSAAQDAEVARNAALWTSPTMPALHRYTGVLYDALDAGSLRGTAAARARARLAVGSALFGLLHADDPVPAYRLSAGSALPSGGTLAARWKPVLEPELAALAEADLVVDLRSGSYAALGRAPGAVTVNVLAERPDGSRSIVSHFNKAHKGRLARVLAGSRAEPTDAAGVAAIARRAGMRVERNGNALEIVIPA